MSVILYSTGCPRCKVIARKLDDKGIKYSIVDKVDVVLELGITNVPVLEVDDRKMEFKEAINWVNSQE